MISTASTKNIDYVRSLGADEVIDYTTTDFTQVLSGIDAALETVGGDVAPRTYEVMRSGGRVAFIGSGMKVPEPPRDDLEGLRPNVVRNSARMERVSELISSGVVRAPEITTYALSAAVEAHKVSEARHLRGKLVFKMG